MSESQARCHSPANCSASRSRHCDAAAMPVYCAHLSPISANANMCTYHKGEDRMNAHVRCTHTLSISTSLQSNRLQKALYAGALADAVVHSRAVEDKGGPLDTAQPH
eukprot:2280544-Amphidinium_carterae.1